jgi:integral membrane protein
MVRAFRVVAMVEAVSYLVLVAAAISRRTTDLADLVPVIGPIHGVIFLVYFGLAMVVRGELRWSVRTTAVVVLASIVPLGGFLVERRLLPHGGHGGRPGPSPARGASARRAGS